MRFVKKFLIGLTVKRSRLGRCRSESEVEKRLAGTLRSAGFSVGRQVGNGNCRADLVVWGIPLELKFDPSKSELDRAVGQVLGYKRVWGDALLVVVGGFSGYRFPRGLSVVRCR